MRKEMEIGSLLDLSFTIASDLFKRARFPWEVLPEIGEYIVTTGNRLRSVEYEEREEDVWVAKDAEIASSAHLCGPLIVDHGAQVRHNAFVRGGVIIGKNAVVGNSTELKNCILFDHVQVPHFNYVGDSILGRGAHLGAGAILSNVRSDRKSVVVHSDEDILTGLRKFGAILGDGAEVGCGAVLNPGAVVGRGSVIYPLSCVRGTVPENCIFKTGGRSIKKREEA